VAGFDPRPKVISFSGFGEPNGTFEFESKTRSEGALISADHEASPTNYRRELQ
jgi:hypothetical protein